MRALAPVVVLALCLPTLAAADDLVVDVGAHLGVVGFDGVRLPSGSWYAAPRVTVWFKPWMAGELDIGFSAGRSPMADTRYAVLAPMAWLVATPLPDARIQPLLTAGLGATAKHLCTCTDAVDERFGRLEATPAIGAGLAIGVTHALRVRLDLKMLIGTGPDDPLFNGPFLSPLATVGLAVRLGGAPDGDHDGVPDRSDLCPGDREDRDGWLDEDGCADLDDDEDGLPDHLDQCPRDAEDIDMFDDVDGCPDPDNDGDGVPDVGDACPMSVGTAATLGCPDADGDGLNDVDDACPHAAGDVDGCPDSDGDGIDDGHDRCPADPGPAEGCPDRDGDTVADVDDACPDEALRPGADPTRSNGCPARVFVTDDEIAFDGTILFERGTAVLDRSSHSLLEEMAAVLARYPEVGHIRVEGHTDSEGSASFNLRLSQGRAVSVARFLVEAGVDGSRLTPVGYGESRPVASNRTDAGKAKNRRVVFRIVKD